MPAFGALGGVGRLGLSRPLMLPHLLPHRRHEISQEITVREIIVQKMHVVSSEKLAAWCPSQCWTCFASRTARTTPQPPYASGYGGLT